MGLYGGIKTVNKLDRIKDLVELLNHYRNEYYNNSCSKISDFEYDQLFDELTQLESETGFIMAVSPTQTVGYEVVSELEKVEHNHPMLSLDKTKSVDDIIKFLDNKDGVVMAKVDGLTCSLRYVNGHLISAETRGNGEVGEDILHCAKTIKNIPLEINCLDEVIVDGEVIITYDDFEKINANLPEGQKYKHPRNLASGSIRQLDSSIAAQRNMKFIAWKLIKGINSNSFFDNWLFMDSLGFDVVMLLSLPSQLINKQLVENAIYQIQDNAKNECIPIDGCVFGYDDIAYGESLGATGHHLRSQLAFKFYDELYPTKLQYIDWTIGKSAQLTPTAVFDAVEIDGTEVTRASLHNISIIKNLGLTNGCTVNVFKANQIIPQIDSCDNDGSGEIKIPSTCPICGGDAIIKKDNESEVLICTNPECAGKKLAQFTHFVSKKGMDIKNLSEATLETLISHGFIHDFKDIYNLNNHKQQLIHIDGYGKKSIENLLKSIRDSRDVKLENFITALGIPNIGLSAAKTISKYFNGDYEEFIQAYFYWHFDWTKLDDFGKVMADSINTYLHDNLEEINELAAEMNFVLPEEYSVTENPFNGKTICVTGKLNHFTRDSINDKIISLGAKTAGSVSKKTDYLITNESSGSSKYKKAIELNIPIITEEKFLNMIGDD
jgi:DNA ligase (NAD+)